MAIIDTHPVTIRKNNLWATTVRTFSNLFDRYVERRRQRRALVQLRGLDTRTLRDIAIDRSELSSVVHGNPRGRKRAYRKDLL